MAQPPATSSMRRLDEFLETLHHELQEDDALAHGSLSGQNFLARSTGFFPQFDRAAAWVLVQQGIASHKLAVLRAAMADGASLIGIRSADQQAATTETLRARAARCYEQALALDPECANARFNLGRLAEDEGRTKDALVHYDAAVRDEWYRPHAYLRIGFILSESNEIDEAATFLGAAVQLYPDFGELHHRIANILRQAGRIEAALEEYEKTIESRHYFPPEFVLRPPPLLTGAS